VDEFLISRKNNLVSSTFGMIDFKNSILNILRKLCLEKCPKSKLDLPKRP